MSYSRYATKNFSPGNFLLLYKNANYIKMLFQNALKKKTSIFNSLIKFNGLITIYKKTKVQQRKSGT